jgi:hypothetical protein
MTQGDVLPRHAEHVRASGQGTDCGDLLVAESGVCRQRRDGRKGVSASSDSFLQRLRRHQLAKHGEPVIDLADPIGQQLPRPRSKPPSLHGMLGSLSRPFALFDHSRDVPVQLIELCGRLCDGLPRLGRGDAGKVGTIFSPGRCWQPALWRFPAVTRVQASCQEPTTGFKLLGEQSGGSTRLVTVLGLRLLSLTRATYRVQPEV